MNFKINNPTSLCEFKFDNSENGEFEGYGSVFDSVDKSNDTIVKGAYVDSLNDFMPKMFINHNHMDIPVGDWVEAKEDDHGLLMRGKIDLNHRDGTSLYSALLAKRMDGLSIGALKNTLKFTRKNDGGKLITKADLREVSVVTFPMEESATILAVKSDIETINDLKEAELFLRDSGVFSKSAAMAFVSRIKKLARSDSDAMPINGITMLEKRLKAQIATDSLMSTLKRL